MNYGIMNMYPPLVHINLNSYVPSIFNIGFDLIYTWVHLISYLNYLQTFLNVKEDVTVPYSIHKNKTI